MSLAYIEMVIGDVRTNEIRDQLTNLRDQRAALTSIYTEKHSKVQAVEAQIDPRDAALKAHHRATHASST